QGEIGARAPCDHHADAGPEPPFARERVAARALDRLGRRRAAAGEGRHLHRRRRGRRLQRRVARAAGRVGGEAGDLELLLARGLGGGLLLRLLLGGLLLHLGEQLAHHLLVGGLLAREVREVALQEERAALVL